MRPGRWQNRRRSYVFLMVVRNRLAVPRTLLILAQRLASDGSRSTMFVYRVVSTNPPCNPSAP